MNKKIMALFVLISFLTRIYIEAFSSSKSPSAEKKVVQSHKSDLQKNFRKNNLEKSF